MSKNKITVKGVPISLKDEGKGSYISLTDIAKQIDDEPRFVIRNWMKTAIPFVFYGLGRICTIQILNVSN